MNQFWEGIITIATAIIGLAIIAVVLSKNATTASVLGAAGSAFAKDIQAATAPITGGGLFTGGGVSSLSFQ